MTGVYEGHHVTMATNSGNKEHLNESRTAATRCLVTKISIGFWTREIVFKMTAMLQYFLETIFAASEFIKHYVYMPLLWLWLAYQNTHLVDLDNTIYTYTT